MKGDIAAAIDIAIVEDKVALVIEVRGDRDPVVAVMTSRETHRLRSRLHKAANDAASAGERKRQASS